jgi:outer membrane protein, heavy metal efflux system
MSLKNIIIFILVILHYHRGKTQSGITAVVDAIKRNNKELRASVHYYESESLHFKTGLTLPNPAIGFDYMIGSPSTAGNQTDFTITQAFDFPTVYTRKKALSNLQIAQLPFMNISVRQNILLDAQKTCNEIIYLNKMLAELTKRKLSAEKLMQDFVQSMKNGDGNMIDVNKTKLHLADINASYRHHQSLLQQASQKLKSLNGEVEIIFTDSLYSLQDVSVSVDALLTESIKNDPNIHYLESEKLIAQQEISVAKAMTLPKIEAGYHYQAILGQRFQGGHVGFSIPLWENRNLVQSKDAKWIFADAQLDVQRNKRFFELRQVYSKYESTKIQLDEYKSVLASSNSLSLLTKALEMGQISSIAYFMETSFFYNTMDKYLTIEREYHDLIYEMNKYKL